MYFPEPEDIQGVYIRIYGPYPLWKLLQESPE